MKLKCLHCEHEFDGTISCDDLGWHSSCPVCDASFDVDVPDGKFVVAWTDPIDDDDGSSDYTPFDQAYPEWNIVAYYAYNTKEDLFAALEEFIEDPISMWYWIVGEDKHVLLSGACDPMDIDILMDAFGMREDDDYEF